MLKRMYRDVKGIVQRCERECTEMLKGMYRDVKGNVQRCESGVKGDINRNKESLDGIKGDLNRNKES